MRGASAAIPLAHKLTPEGELSEESKLRIDKALEVVEKHGLDFVVMNSCSAVSTETAGYDLYIHEPPIADVMKDYAIELGFPEHRILKETYSSDTIGEAYFIKEIVLRPRWIRSVIVVTSDYHMHISMIIFEKVLGVGYLVEGVKVETGLADKPTIKAHEEDSLEKFLGQFGDVRSGHSKIIEHGLYDSHPLYSKLPETDRLRFY